MSDRRDAMPREAAPSSSRAPGADTAAVTEAAGPREIDEWMYEVTARLAHDMRTPLGAIRMWSHVLRTGREADRPFALDAIEASTADLSEHMAFLADVTRAVVGQLPIERQACELGSLVRHGVDAAATALGRRLVKVELQREPPEDEPLVLDGDPGRLLRAFNCMVAAAGAFIAAEGTVMARLASERGPGSARAAVFTVRAPRARVDEAELRHLFTPYHPGKADLGHARPDFGLGLVFARCLVRMHGGDVEGAWESGDEAALVVTARLPLRTAAPGRAGTSP